MKLCICRKTTYNYGHYQECCWGYIPPILSIKQLLLRQVGLYKKKCKFVLHV